MATYKAEGFEITQKSSKNEYKYAVIHTNFHGTVVGSFHTSLEVATKYANKINSDDAFTYIDLVPVEKVAA
jgi:hypothetical protein